MPVRLRTGGAPALRHDTTLHFSNLTPALYSDIRRILAKSNTRSCDYSLGVLVMWADYFKYSCCIHSGTLFVKCLDQDGSGRQAFLLPCGEMPFDRSVELLKNYCRGQGIPLIFTAVPEDRLPEVGACSPLELPVWTDYIYEAAHLASLTGKAYNKKRNHVNRFVADNPGWQLLPLDASTMHHALDLATRIHSFERKVDPAMAQYELEHCLVALRQYDALGFEGAVLLNGGGRPVAFTAGERYGDTLILHIEKADHEVAGAGEAINQFFAHSITDRHPEIKYINREDDSGDPGLQQAKLSYHPEMLLRKYDVVME